MTHLDEGRVQAFLDNELSPQERAAAAEHMLECPECRSRHAAQRGVNALFSDAVRGIESPVPEGRPMPGLAATARRGASSLARAAVLVLLLAAAASAAVPGSPVRGWVEQAMGLNDPTPAAPATAAEDSISPIAPAEGTRPAPVALSVVAPSGPVVVDLEDLDGTAVRVRTTGGDRVRLSVSGADRDPTFRVEHGAIGARGGVGGELLIEIPASLESGQIVLDGRIHAQVQDGRLAVRVPGEATDGGVVWR